MSLLLIHLLVAKGTSETFDAPGFLQRLKYVSDNNVVAHEADVSEKLKNRTELRRKRKLMAAYLMKVCLAISQTLLFVMPSTQEWFLAFGADEVLKW